MPVESEEPTLEEQEGGPVKSFLEHLEDLRWMLIKICAVSAVTMLVCLFAGNYVVQILERPLMKAKISLGDHVQSVSLLWGTNQLGTFKVNTNDLPALPFGTNQFVGVQVEPIVIGTNVVLGLKTDPKASLSDAQKLPIQIINLSPAGAFLVATKIAFYAGLVLASPFIIYFITQFVFPALKWKERKYIYRGLLVGLGLFATGVCFCYFVLMPVALTASVQYAEWLGFAATQWRAEDYISFVCKFMLGMGIGFELPVVILVLVKIGILNYTILARARRYVIVISFVLGAVLTTPEVITQVLMAIPLIILYEITVWIAWYWERKEKKRRST